MTTSETKPAPLQPQWDESQFEAALRHLERVRNQISDVRWNIPQMLRTLSKDFDSPQRMYAEFERLAYLSVSGHKELRASWESDYLQDILDKAYDIQVANQGSNVVVSEWVEQIKTAEKDVDQRPNWDKDLPIYKSLDELEDSGYSSAGSPPSASEITTIVEQFQKNHPNLTVGYDEEHKVIMVVVPVFGGIEFTIEQSDEGDNRFKVSCKGHSMLCKAITRSVRMHPLQNDIHYILDLIASYSNIQTQPCAVCKTVLDGGTALPPVTRRLKVEKQPDGKKKATWISLHNTCHRYVA